MASIQSNILISLHIALVSTFLVMLVGLPIAWALARPHWRGRRLLDVLVNLPLALPPAVLGFYLLMLIGREGPIGRLSVALTGKTLIFTREAAIIASVVVTLPLFVQAARNALEDVPHEVYEAAQIDGASAWKAFRFIFVPLAWPGIWTGVLLAYARSIGEFGATLIVAGNIPGVTQTMALAIYSAIQGGNYDKGLVLSAMLTALAGLSIWVGLRFRRDPTQGLQASGRR